MKKILKLMLIATMMLTAFLALSTAEDVTKSTTSTTTTPAPDVTQSTTTTTTPTTPGSGATKSTTTTTTPSSEPTTTTKSTSTTTSTPGFEATFAVAGILAVTFIALRRRH